MVGRPNFNYVGHNLQERVFWGQISQVGAGFAIFHKRTAKFGDR